MKENLISKLPMFQDLGARRFGIEEANLNRLVYAMIGSPNQVSEVLLCRSVVMTGSP